MAEKKKKNRLILNIKHIPPLFIWYSSCNHQKILNTKKVGCYPHSIRYRQTPVYT